MNRMSGAIILGIFLAVALFGLPLLLSHTDHHTGCPLQGAQQVMCESTIIDHFSMWQSMFASMLALALAFVAFIVITRAPDAILTHERQRFRVRAVISHRPPLMQELYARGIHNRKEAYGL